MTFHYKPGLNNVAEYMASGLPFVTRSLALTSPPTNVQLPYVTNYVHVRNAGSVDLHVGFTANGVTGTNYFTVPSGSYFAASFRITDLFLVGDSGTCEFELVAGLTQIAREQFYILTGSMAGNSGTIEQNLEYGLRGFGYPGLG